MALKTEFLKYRDSETGVDQLYEVIPPAPTESDRGGIIASPKTENETVEAKLGENGKLYVPDGTKDYNMLENTPTKLSQFENDLEMATSWNDLEDRPFYENIFDGIEYTCDGYIGDREVLKCTINNDQKNCIKISNVVPTEEQAKYITFKVINSNDEISGNYNIATYPGFIIGSGYMYIDYVVPTMSNQHVLGKLIIVQTLEGAELLGLNETGVYHTINWTPVDNQLLDYISELHMQPANIVKSIDEKFIPDTIARKSDLENAGVTSWNDLEDKPFGETSGGDTLTWDGNTAGLTVVNNICAKVSDLIPSDELLSNSIVTILEKASGNEQEVNVSEMIISDNDCTLLGELVFIVKNAGIEKYGMQFNETGIYFLSMDDGYTKSLYIPNYTGFSSIQQLDEKFIPDTIARTQYVDENFALKSELDNIDLSDYETKTDAANKLAEAKEYADGLVEANNDFEVNVTPSMSDSGIIYTSDKTYTEIVEANTAGKNIVGYVVAGTGKTRMDFLGIMGTDAVFSGVGCSIMNNDVRTYLSAAALFINADGITTSSKMFNIGDTSTIATNSKELVGAINELHDEISNIDIPEQVKVNWDENNNTKSSYIENRPFYMTKDPEAVYVLPETTFELDGNQSFESDDDYGVILEADKKYNVTFNDVLYENVPCENVNGTLLLGSLNLQFTDYPFVFGMFNGGLAIKCHENTQECVTSISLPEIDPGEMYIESKYTSHFQADWDEVDSTKIGYIKNKPFGSRFEDTVLIKTAELGFAQKDNDTFYNHYISLAVVTEGINLNNTYEVIWDDQVYTLQPKVHPDINAPYLGSTYLGISVGTCDFTDYPFCIIIARDNNMSAAGIATNSTESSHTVGVKAINAEIIKQLDIKYLPIMEEVLETVFEIEEIEAGSNIEDPTYKTIHGQYKVTIDGESEIVEFINHGDSSSTEGSFFTIEIWDGGIWFGCADEGTHSVKIEKIKDAVKEEHLPGNIARKEEIPDNIVQYEVLGEERENILNATIRDFESFNDTNIYYANLEIRVIGAEGINYEVVFDGNSYTVTSIKYNNRTYLGNLYLVDSSCEDTGEPFCIESHRYDSIYTHVEGDSHTISVTAIIPIKKIDEELIPYTIARTEDVPTKVSQLEMDVETGVKSWEDLEDKPFYKVENEIILVDNLTSEDYVNEQPKCDFNDDHTYRVILNGEVYDNLTTHYIKSYGNVLSSGQELPFLIRDDDYSDLLYIENIEGEYVISIIDVTPNYYINEESIPDTIARKSDLQNIDLSSLETKEDAQAKLEAAVGYTHSNYYKKIMIDSKDKAINKKINNISKTITEQNIDTAFNDIFGGE